MSTARTTPGESVVARLFGRDRRRAHVGQSSAFFHRFGVQDPYTVAAPADRIDRLRNEDPGAFVYLSSAAYEADLAGEVPTAEAAAEPAAGRRSRSTVERRSARYRLLRRTTAERRIARAGERVRSGPAALERSSERRSVGSTEPVLVTPTLVAPSTFTPGVAPAADAAPSADSVGQPARTGRRPSARDAAAQGPERRSPARAGGSGAGERSGRAAARSTLIGRSRSPVISRSARAEPSRTESARGERLGNESMGGAPRRKEPAVARAYRRTEPAGLPATMSSVLATVPARRRERLVEALLAGSEPGGIGDGPSVAALRRPDRPGLRRALSRLAPIAAVAARGIPALASAARELPEAQLLASDPRERPMAVPVGERPQQVERAPRSASGAPPVGRGGSGSSTAAPRARPARQAPGATSSRARRRSVDERRTPAIDAPELRPSVEAVARGDRARVAGRRETARGWTATTATTAARTERIARRAWAGRTEARSLSRTSSRPETAQPARSARPWREEASPGPESAPTLVRGEGTEAGDPVEAAFASARRSGRTRAPVSSASTGWLRDAIALTRTSAGSGEAWDTASEPTPSGERRRRPEARGGGRRTARAIERSTRASTTPRRGDAEVERLPTREPQQVAPRSPVAEAAWLTSDPEPTRAVASTWNAVERAARRPPTDSRGRATVSGRATAARPGETSVVEASGAVARAATRGASAPSASPSPRATTARRSDGPSSAPGRAARERSIRPTGDEPIDDAAARALARAQRGERRVPARLEGEPTVRDAARSRVPTLDLVSEPASPPPAVEDETEVSAPRTGARSVSSTAARRVRAGRPRVSIARSPVEQVPLDLVLAEPGPSEAVTPTARSAARGSVLRTDAAGRVVVSPAVSGSAGRRVEERPVAGSSRSSARGAASYAASLAGTTVRIRAEAPSSGSRAAPTLSASMRGLVRTGESVIPRRSLDWSVLAPQIAALTGAASGSEPATPRSERRGGAPARSARGEVARAEAGVVGLRRRTPVGRSADGATEGPLARREAGPVDRAGSGRAAPGRGVARGPAARVDPGRPVEGVDRVLERVVGRSSEVEDPTDAELVAAPVEAGPRRRGAPAMQHAAGRSGSTRRARSAERRSGTVPAGWEDLGVDASEDPSPQETATGAGRRVRTAGGLLTALARAGDPEDLLRLILERSNGIPGRAAELPEPARELVRRIARDGDPDELTTPRRGRAAPETRTITRFRTVVRNASASAPSLRSLKSGPEPGERGVDGMGASGVMKLAGKLMKLIHLAEVERRKADAQRQVRMAENSAEARSEGAGQPGGESINEKATNIKQLQQEVLQAVLRELEMMRWRREDSDGPNSWC